MPTHRIGESIGSVTMDLSHSDSVRCPMCPPEPILATKCGCSLDLLPCRMHLSANEHRHCQTCGVPVFAVITGEDGEPEFEDHTCPPGFIGEGYNACAGLTAGEG